jgi:hypothetical protein
MVFIRKFEFEQMLVEVLDILYKCVKNLYICCFDL